MIIIIIIFIIIFSIIIVIMIIAKHGETALTLIIDVQLIQRLVISKFTDFLLNFQISLTNFKIPWQFPDLEKICFSLTFSLTVDTLIYTVLENRKFSWVF